MTQIQFAAAILAGGASSRFGADKAMVDLGGSPMISHVARALSADKLAIVGHPGAAALLGAESLNDAADSVSGPLAGVLAALDWAARLQAPWLITAPCDAPLLPTDLAARLVAAAEAAGASAAHACTARGLHPLCAAWRPALAARLRRCFADGVHPPVREVATDGVHVLFEHEGAFLNVNTQADLDRVLAQLGAGG
jgi:molybdopterin-guanine dinucleotide biosynthesis protein A